MIFKREFRACKQVIQLRFCFIFISLEKRNPRLLREQNRSVILLPNSAFLSFFFSICFPFFHLTGCKQCPQLPWVFERAHRLNREISSTTLIAVEREVVLLRKLFWIAVNHVAYRNRSTRKHGNRLRIEPNVVSTDPSLRTFKWLPANAPREEI